MENAFQLTLTEKELTYLHAIFALAAASHLGAPEIIIMHLKTADKAFRSLTDIEYITLADKIFLLKNSLLSQTAPLPPELDLLPSDYFKKMTDEQTDL